MSQTYGIESHSQHVSKPDRPPVRYVVVIQAGDAMVAKLLLADRQLAGELDAGMPEVIQMITGLKSAHNANGPEWDAALRGHSVQERTSAQVYTLAV